MGQREPIRLVVLKGKKHLSKEEIDTRKEQEVKAKSDRIGAPRYLPAELRSDFNKIAKELQRIDLISNLDLDALARFLLAREQYVRCSMLIRDTDPVEDHYMYGKLSSSVKQFFDQSRAAASDLGLTISSRCRLLVPKSKKVAPDEFDEKFGDV
jgi:P27 family predicted phage terminase small subunit